MCGVTREAAAAERARWLAELSATWNEALQLLFELDLSGVSHADAGDLYHRIQTARFEVHALQSSRIISPRGKPHPKRIDFPLWQPMSGSR